MGSCVDAFLQPGARPPAWSDRLPAFFTDPRVEVLPGAGHLVRIEQPAVAAADTAAFVAALDDKD